MEGLIPPLQQDETPRQLVDWLNGDLLERAGTPWPENVYCHYCTLPLSEAEIADMDGFDRNNYEPSEFIYCKNCSGTAARHIAG